MVTKSPKNSANIIIPIVISAVALVISLFAALAAILVGLMLARRKAGKVVMSVVFYHTQLDFIPL